MTADADLADLASLCGIFDQFRDLEGVIRPTSPDTQRALLRSEGLAVDSAAELRDTLAAVRAAEAARVIPAEVVVAADHAASIACQQPIQWQLILEDTDGIFAEGRSDTQVDLPPMPAGLHELHLRQDGRRHHCTVIAAPARTPALRDVAATDRTWGVVAALYGLRSDRNHGVGDFEDLAQLAELLGQQGAGFLGINPVHALGWAAEEVISPYSPSHRGFLNTGHIALDRLPGVASGRIDETDSARIDYGSANAAHRAVLQTAFATFQQSAAEVERQALARFAEEGGPALADFARFEHLSTTLGQDWRKWPTGFRTPAKARLGEPLPEMSFHIWLQWLADRQLADAQGRARAAGMVLGLYLDLAVGARLDGAEAWGAADTLARGVSLGAPPDHLSPAGQNWQLAAYAPRKLAARKYAPLRQVLRQAMRHCGVLRIDHALGLNRSYWIPEDGSPGGYIRQPFAALTALIAIEAQRAGTVIVGEDLGLVPEGFRDTMAAQGFYGYTVLQYEKTETGAFRKPADLRAQSLACFSTHDTPTIKGFWAGQDIDWWHRLNWIDRSDKARAERQRADEKADLLGVKKGDLTCKTAEDLRARVHSDLAQGPAALVAVQLDDILGMQEAQNLPGTIDEHPNWRRKSPGCVAELARHPEMKKTAQLMAKAGRSGAEKQS